LKVKVGPPRSVTEAPLTVSPPEVPLLTSTRYSTLAPTRVLGSWLHDWFGIRLAFTTAGASLACAVMTFPLMVRAIRLALEAVDPRLEQAARSPRASRHGV